MIKHCLLFWVYCLLFLSITGDLAAAVKTVSPGDDLQAAVDSLVAGDTLLFGEGVYTRTTALYFDSLQGTEDKPIVVGVASGEHAVLQLDSTYTIFVLADWDHNVIHLRNCSYLEISGLEITAGRTGIETEFTNSHCTFRALEIHHVGNVGIRIANGNNSYMKCIDNHIHHTYQHGEGFYIGDNDGSSDINNCLFEGNYVHHTSLLQNQGDGIELKKGCWSNIIRYNVFHDTHYPGIIAWGTGKKDPQYNNRIHSNLVFLNSSGEHGIQVASECDVYNNIIFDGGNRKMYSALFSSENLSSGTPMNNVRIFNNTFFATQRGVLLQDWQGKEGMVFANNAIFCLNSSDMAFSTNASDLSGVVIEHNYYYGSVVLGDGINSLPVGSLVASRPASTIFQTPENGIATINLYPLANSHLLDAASGSWVAEYDFNGTVRGEGIPADVGAYEFVTETNPGWKLAAEAMQYPGKSGLPSGTRTGCDYNGDGSTDLNDVIGIIIDGRNNPEDPKVDYNGDGIFTIADALELMLDIAHGKCP